MDKDIQILQHILKYCCQIEETINRFGQTFEAFETDSDYQSSISFSILQIGELTKRISNDFRQEYKQIPWKDISGMRDLFAHQYASMNINEIWHTANEDIPALKKFCQELLKSEDQ